jgi:hypothetical protein
MFVEITIIIIIKFILIANIFIIIIIIIAIIHFLSIEYLINYPPIKLLFYP